MQNLRPKTMAIPINALAVCFVSHLNCYPQNLFQAKYKFEKNKVHNRCRENRTIWPILFNGVILEVYF